MLSIVAYCAGGFAMSVLITLVFIADSPRLNHACLAVGLVGTAIIAAQPEGFAKALSTIIIGAALGFGAVLFFLGSET